MAPLANLGRYRLIAELGQGGMADVYLAMVAGPMGSGFTKLAVVKRLRPNLVEDPDFVAMLVDEARLSARLNHPNVVQTLEVGVEQEEYYLAMEFLDGQPLHRIHRRATRTGTTLPRDLACLVIADVLSGLHHAHDLADYDGSPLGVVHRDVNPQNVFITYDGTVKVVDFGIAKAAGRVAETRQGVVKGKVRYMSPEQAFGGDLDRRSDIFAVGLMLWEAATGKRFWGEMEDLDIIHALVSGDYDPSPRAVNSSVPAELDAMCQRALAVKPEDRYATADDLRDELESYLSESLVAARRRLGALVAGMFVKERAAVRTVIEEASRSTSEAPSMAILLGVSQALKVTAENPSSGSGVVASIPPVPITNAPPPTVALPATTSRQASTWVALAVMIASLALLAIVLRQSADRSAASAFAERHASEVLDLRVELSVSSAQAKLPPVAIHPASDRFQGPALVRRTPASALADTTARREEAPRTSAELPASLQPEQRHRPRATLDTTDPWNNGPK